jgi:hypothetical protein
VRRIGEVVPFGQRHYVDEEIPTLDLEFIHWDTALFKAGLTFTCYSIEFPVVPRADNKVTI